MKYQPFLLGLVVLLKPLFSTKMKSYRQKHFQSSSTTHSNKNIILKLNLVLEKPIDEK